MRMYVCIDFQIFLLLRGAIKNAMKSRSDGILYENKKILSDLLRRSEMLFV